MARCAAGRMSTSTAPLANAAGISAADSRTSRSRAASSMASIRLVLLSVASLVTVISPLGLSVSSV